MKRWQIRNASIRRLALVKVGANRQRRFMLKGGGGEETAVSAMAPLIKEAGTDWRVAYFPVAVPHSEEGQGLLAVNPDDVDVWEPDDIAKAAHEFLTNGPKIIAEHFDSEEANGVKLVESAVAPTDFMVGEPPTLVKEGTWYVGIQIDDAATREKIESKEIDAVSVEGLADRILMKTETFSKPGTADVTPSDAAKIRPLAEHYLKLPHPFTSCVRDQVKHGLSDDHAKRRCAVLLDTFDPERLRHSMQKEDAITVGRDERAAELAELVVVADQQRDGLLTRIAKALGIGTDVAPEGLPVEGGTVEDVDINDRVESLEKLVTGQGEKLDALVADDGILAKLATGMEGLAKRLPEPEPTEPTNGELKTALAKAEEGIGKILKPLAERIEALEEGDPQTPDPERTPVAKAAANGGELHPGSEGIFFDYDE